MHLQRNKRRENSKILSEKTKVIFYTTFGELFGDFCYAWRTILEQYGFVVEVLILRNQWKGQLPTVEDSTIDVFVAGLSLLRIVKQFGLPQGNKRILWVVEPLTDDQSSEKHYHKSLVLGEIGHLFDAFIGINNQIVRYLKDHYSDIPIYCIPYVLESEVITPPLRDNEKDIDTLWLAKLQRSSRRRLAYQFFQEASFPVHLIEKGLYGQERDRKISQSRISLEVHGDHILYCNQFRLFMAWAKGSVILSEPCEDYTSFGIKDGVHLVIAKLEDFPKVCAELLQDPYYREKITCAAQELLEQQFTINLWVDQFVDIIFSLNESYFKS